ncbi:MAG: protein-disulfide reductase DsbD family protein [Polyangiales bacterium]
MLRRGLVGIAIVWAAACGGGNEPGSGASSSAGGASSPTTPAPPAPAAPAAPAGPRVDRDNFQLAAATDGAALHAGQLGQVKITLTARNGWHVNQDFPVSVEVSGPSSLSFPKARLERGDAAAFDEAHFEFQVPVTPGAAGEQELRAKVAFAICTETNCLPQEEQLALRVAVQ